MPVAPLPTARRLRPVVGLAIGLSGLAAFAAAQLWLGAVRDAHWAASAYQWWQPPFRGWDMHGPSSSAYVGALLLAVTAARSTPRWWVPIALLAVGPALTGGVVAPLSWAWTYPPGREWIVGRWVPVVFDWAAVAVPAWLLARRSAPVPRCWDRAAVGAAVFAAVTVVVCAYGLALAHGALDGTREHLPLAAAVFAGAAVARGTGRIAVGAAALLLADPGLAVAAWRDLDAGTWLWVPETVRFWAWPLRLAVIATAAGTAWPLVARGWRRFASPRLRPAGPFRWLTVGLAAVLFWFAAGFLAGAGSVA